MLRRTLMAALVFVVLAAIPPATFAAHPQKGGVYVGLWRGGTNKLKILVSRSGRMARAKVWCFRTFQGTSPRFRVSPSGNFAGARYLAGELEWSVKGRFTSATTAVASVHLGIACSGIGSVKRLPTRIIGGIPTVPTSGSVSFAGFPDGTVLTTQTASQGVTFGSAQALGFPGTLPGSASGGGPYVCPAGPTIQRGVAVAPSCPGGPTGYSSSGTLAKFATPVSSLSVRVGSSIAAPGGFAAEVDAYTASGSPVTQDAAVVGSSTNGQGAGPSETVQLTAPGGETITYIALFFNSYTASGAQLLFDTLMYTRS